MKLLIETDRALVLPADISIPEAYILGYKKAVEVFLKDLRSYPHNNRVLIKDLIEKWEAILNIAS